MSGLAKRGGWAFLLSALVLAVVGAGPGALLAQNSPNSDTDGIGMADYQPEYSACVGDAYLEPEASGPFLDVRGWNLEDEIYCVAQYGITVGRTATEFSPSEPTLRWQMALFLYRAALPAGLVLPNPAQDQGFTDIGGLSDEARQAVNSLAQAGIMPGMDDLFHPNDRVSRQSMAELMAAFLRSTIPGTGAFGPDASRLEEVRPDRTVFTDTGHLFAGAYRAIELIYELGITEGKTATTYAPDDPVTRAQMAAFITRMLSHTLARPKGVSVQIGSGQGAEVEVTASVRDVAYQPRQGAPVDMFWIGDPQSVLSTARNCRDAEVVGSGARLCAIDADDDLTNAGGDVTITINQQSGGKVWAWTGKAGDRVRSAPAGMISGSLGVGSARIASRLRVSDDLNENQLKLKYGRSVTFTLQLVDGDGLPLDVKDVAIRISSTEIAPSGGTGSRTDIRTHRTDGRGQIILTYNQVDPEANSNNGDAELTLTLHADTISPENIQLEDRTTAGLAATGAAGEEATVIWSDDQPVATALVLDQMVSNQPASDAGKGVSHRVMATVIDQYGARFSGVRRVFFDSDDRDGAGQSAAAGAGAFRRTTTRGGIATLDYRRDAEDSGVELIRAWVNQPDGPTLDSNELAHYWTESPAGRTAVGVLRLIDVDANRLVFENRGREVWAASYDSNDRFLNRSGLAISMTEFENELREAEGRRLTVEGYAESPSGATRFTLG